MFLRSQPEFHLAVKPAIRLEQTRSAEESAKKIKNFIKNIIRQWERGATMHALIIEDDSRVGLAIWSFLQDFGFESVTIAQTKQAAVEDALRARPDFITCDVHLREGLGTHAVSLIRKIHGSVPMVYITASPATITDSDPAAPIIVKPFSRRSLFDALNIGGIEVERPVKAASDDGWQTRIFGAH